MKFKPNDIVEISTRHSNHVLKKGDLGIVLKEKGPYKTHIAIQLLTARKNICLEWYILIEDLIKIELTQLEKIIYDLI